MGCLIQLLLLEFAVLTSVGAFRSQSNGQRCHLRLFPPPLLDDAANQFSNCYHLLVDFTSSLLGGLTLIQRLDPVSENTRESSRLSWSVILSMVLCPPSLSRSKRFLSSPWATTTTTLQSGMSSRRPIKNSIAPSGLPLSRCNLADRLGEHLTECGGQLAQGGGDVLRIARRRFTGLGEAVSPLLRTFEPPGAVILHYATSTPVPPWSTSNCSTVTWTSSVTSSVRHVPSRTWSVGIIADKSAASTRANPLSSRSAHKAPSR